MTLARQRQSLQARELRADYVPHLGIEEVRRLARAARETGRRGERDGLMIEFLFDSCLRNSEARGVRPIDMVQDGNGWSVRIIGKGGKPGQVAISTSMAAKMQAYAYQEGLGRDERFFAVNRHRVYQIIDRAFDVAGIVQPPHVGAVHVLRHSGAIERMRQTGNPKAVQDQLRHADAAMTLRYFKTLRAEESLAIQQEVDFGW